MGKALYIEEKETLIKAQCKQNTKGIRITYQRLEVAWKNIWKNEKNFEFYISFIVYKPGTYSNKSFSDQLEKES